MLESREWPTSFTIVTATSTRPTDRPHQSSQPSITPTSIHFEGAGDLAELSTPFYCFRAILTALIEAHVEREGSLEEMFEEDFASRATTSTEDEEELEEEQAEFEEFGRSPRVSNRRSRARSTYTAIVCAHTRACSAPHHTWEGTDAHRATAPLLETLSFDTPPPCG